GGDPVPRDEGEWESFTRSGRVVVRAVPCLALVRTDRYQSSGRHDIMRDASSWRPAGAFVPPVEVTAADVTPVSMTSVESGLDVGSTAFASPTAGWALVGAPLAFRLLYTEDAGATWTPQLAWQT